MHRKIKGGGIPKKKPRELSPSLLEPPTTDKGVMLGIRGDSKTVVDWIDGHAKMKTPDSDCTVAPAQNRMWDWWEVLTCDDALLTGRYIFFVNITKKPMFGQGKVQEAEKKNVCTLRTWPA